MSKAPNKSYKLTTYLRKNDLEKVVDSFWSPSIRDWRDIIEDYIEVAKIRKNNKLAMFKLQISIISDLLNVSDGIKAYIKLIDHPHERIKQLPNKEITDEDIQFWENEVNVFKIVEHALRVIGDGIAWRVLDFDRALIYNICINNQSSGLLSINRGLISELRTIGDFVDDKSVVQFVYHGITNFMRIDDITVKYNDGKINSIEVKSGKNPRGTSWRKRLKRQEERRNNISSLANNRKGKSGGIDVTIESIDGKPVTCINKISTLLNRAKNKEVITQIFYSYLGISVSNFEKIVNKDNFYKLENLLEQIKHKEDDDVRIYESVKSFIFSPNRAPWSVYPFSSEIIANILTGKYIVVYFFNLSQFYREFEKKGWVVSNTIDDREDKKDKSMFHLEKGNVKITFPPLLFSRAIYEGLSINSIIKILNDIDKKRAGYFYSTFHEFEKEKYLWE